MRITIEDVEYVAALSTLYVSEQDKRELQKDLDEIIGHVEKLNELDTTDVEPTTYILKQQNILREDIVKQELGREELIQNAPQKEDGCFLVPRVVE